MSNKSNVNKNTMENLMILFVMREDFNSGLMWFIPFLCMVIFFVLFLVFRRGGMGPFFDRSKQLDNSDNKNSSAIDILKNRYAKGEISKEEYDRIKRDIS